MSYEKKAGESDFRKIPNGLPGVETTLSLLYSQGVLKGRISLNRLAQVTSFNPAKIFGLYPQKGDVKPGFDADLVIVDPEKEMLITPASMHGQVDYSPFEGLKVKGIVAATISRGEVVYKDGEIFGSPGRGKIIPRKIDFESRI